MSKYYDINTAAEEAAKNAQPTPCELLQKVQFLQRDYDMLLMRFTKKCKERDDLTRTLDQTVTRLNDETKRADALQKRCDDLEQSRQAWATKAAELDAKLENEKEDRVALADLCETLQGHLIEAAMHPIRYRLRELFGKDVKSE